MERSRKDMSLEFLRGLASVFVLAHHLILSFFPAYSGMFDKSNLQSTERASILSFATNGASAVIFFFCLSGFVLSRNFFVHGDRTKIIEGVVKRWPRLAGPVLLSVLLSWIFIHTNAYRHEQVGTLVNSPWLKQFGYAFDDGKTFPSTSLWAALWQGTFLVFFSGQNYFNSNLWTMQFEFAASLMIFGLTLLMGPRDRSKWLGLFFVFLVGSVQFFHNTFYLAFIVGLGLAFVLPTNRIEIRPAAAVVLILISLYLLGYYDDAVGPFTFIHALVPKGLDQHHVMMVGSLLLIFTVESCSALRERLSSRLAALIGELSFPLYLVHIPLICAVGCRVFLHGRKHHWTDFESRIGAAGATVIASIIFALLLMYLSRPWLRFVSDLSRKLVNEAARRNDLFGSARSM